MCRHGLCGQIAGRERIAELVTLHGVAEEAAGPGVGSRHFLPDIQGNGRDAIRFCVGRCADAQQRDYGPGYCGCPERVTFHDVSSDRNVKVHP